MHLQGYPKYYVKNGKRRAVCYTAEARDLMILGWQPEDGDLAPAIPGAEVPKEEKAEEIEHDKQGAQEVVEAELVDDLNFDSKKQNNTSLPEFEFMTKVELLKYAMDRGVDLPNNILKAELVKACRDLQNV